MKNISFYSLLALLAVLFASCAKEEYTLYAPADKTAGIQGNWKLRTIEIKDESSLIELSTVDISALTIGATPMVMSFQGQNFTVTPGTTQNVVGMTAGIWAFNNPLYPKTLSFTDAGGASNTLTLGAPTRPQDNVLVITFKGGCAGAASKYIYILTFDRSN